MGNFLRTVLHLIVWILAVFVWAATFTQLPVAWVMLKYYAQFLALFQLGRVFMVILIDILALAFDSADDLWHGNNEYVYSAEGQTGLGDTIQEAKIYKEQYAMGNRQQGKGKWLRFIKSWDYKMEMLNISLQAIAYPLLHFGVEGSW